MKASHATAEQGERADISFGLSLEVTSSLRRGSSLALASKTRARRHKFSLMTIEDQKELDRLCSLLRSIEEQNTLSSDQSEALRKSAFALHLTFLAKLRSKLDLLYANPPLTDEEREKLRSYGIDPDTGQPIK